ncbi:HesA/MoeB/ThiF family protein [Pedobacter sp. MC2016-15]|uniref:HesA/MoeB/ThiF family protein n=1 Tax=Pedobacter sp. MC2016-15 TaxID=2994473 RepID=UPI0022484442|nr:HesA/MoeB/ThiF family protein [Pedobacter sp. MC2016-15]MCX2481766.1 HesA/MoeB/ThiF family protein [Pedobacter sp. MC2016-15]
MAVKGKERYARQMILKDFGPAGQQKLYNAKVLVIGAGGLGCPILQYLAAAGVGTLGIVDHDVVELSNLHRQILYSVADVGRLKADCAAEKLSLFNPDINIIAYPLELSNQNAALIMSKFDIIIDGSDNFPTRYMVNDACALLHLPLIYGALSESEGQVAIFNVSDADGRKVNYRDIFPNPPQPGEVLNCAEAGVLGVLPGIIGTMQAAEAIKLISGTGEPLINQMLIYNLYNNSTYKVNLSPDEASQRNLPSDLDAFLQTDYNWFCGIRATTSQIEELSPGEFREMLFDEDYEIIDVREDGELPEATFDHIRIPLSEIRKQVPAIDKDKVILFCHSGVRSILAGEILQEVYPGKEFYSLKGGILRLN